MTTPAPGPAATGFERTYPGTTDQAHVVRTDLHPLLADCPVADDVILCASELAANAALHSDSGLPHGRYTFRATIHPGDYVWIEAEDEGGPWADPTAGTGLQHGLDIINTLATDWGVTTSTTGRLVWARFDWTTTEAAQ